jgi:hypothetical protein
MAGLPTCAEVPLPALLGKADASSIKISPGGRWLAWLVRQDGVLNMWAAPVTSTISGNAINEIPGAFPLTKVGQDRRDICFAFWFTSDDSRVVYLRETDPGSELYHLFRIDLPLTDATHVPLDSGKDLLAAYPQLTCAVGFVGGIQLWLPADTPDIAYISTGNGSLLWDLSRIDLHSGELTQLYVHTCKLAFSPVSVPLLTFATGK